MRTTQVSVKEAIQVLESKSDDSFLIGQYIGRSTEGPIYAKCCSMGHLYVYIDAAEDLDDTFLKSLQKLVRSFTLTHILCGNGINGDGIIVINDDIKQQRYEGKTPKERVLNILKKMLELGYEIPELKNKENEK